jgi:hypothetical protein
MLGFAQHVNLSDDVLKPLSTCSRRRTDAERVSSRFIASCPLPAVSRPGLFPCGPGVACASICTPSAHGARRKYARTALELESRTSRHQHPRRQSPPRIALESAQSAHRWMHYTSDLFIALIVVLLDLLRPASQPGVVYKKEPVFAPLLPEDPAASLPSRIRRVTRNHSPTCPRTRLPSSLTGTRLPTMRQSSLRNPRDSSPTRGSKSLSSVCALRPCSHSFLDIILSRRAERPVGCYRNHRLWQGRHGRKGYDPHVRRHGALLFPCGLWGG